MGRITYDELTRNLLREKDWTRYTVDKTVRNINRTPDFLIDSLGHLVLEVALEDMEKFQVMIRLMPDVFKQLNPDKQERIVKSLITHESVHQTINIKEKVIHSFGWGIETVLQENRDDKALVQKLTSILNKTGDEVVEEGYFKVIIHLGTGEIQKVDEFKVSDLRDATLRVDIFKLEAMTRSV